MNEVNIIISTIAVLVLIVGLVRTIRKIKNKEEPYRPTPWPGDNNDKKDDDTIEDKDNPGSSL